METVSQKRDTESATSQREQRVEFGIRGQTLPSVYDRQEAVLERLETLEAEGKIADYTVKVWGKSVCTSPSTRTSTATGTLETIEEFASWADRTEVNLEPTFKKRTVTSMITDEKREEIVLPILCLAVYEGDELEAVYPCSDDDGVHTVDDGLETLTADQRCRETFE